MIPGHLPRRMPKSPPKSPLCIFLIQDGRNHVTLFFEKNRGIPYFLTFAVKKIYLGVSTYVLRHKEFIQMIKNNISTFLNTKNQDGRQIVLSMLSDLLKKRKYKVSISLLKLTCIS